MKARHETIAPAPPSDASRPIVPHLNQRNCADGEGDKKGPRAGAFFWGGVVLFGDDVDEFAGDDDDFGDGEAGGVFLDFGGFAGGGFEGEC